MRTHKLPLFVLTALFFACSTPDRIQQVQDVEGIVNIRQPMKSEKKQMSDSLHVPKQIKIKDKDGKEQTILAGEKDEKQGDYLYSVSLGEVEVLAKSKTVPERDGKISIAFVINVPEGYLSSDWRMKVTPTLLNNGEEKLLEPVVLSGKGFLKAQKRSNYYQDRMKKQAMIQDKKYRLRIKAREPYKYRADDSAEKIQTQMDTWADTHERNENVGWRLDSVIPRKGHFEYYYNQEFPADDMEKKLKVWFNAQLFDIDGTVYDMPQGDTLNYFISSMMQFLDRTPRYVRQVIQRKVTESTSAYITFPAGSTAVLDTMGNNAAEIDKVRKKMDEINRGNEFIVDSIEMISACSPEGNFMMNQSLAKGRAASLKKYMQPILETNAEAIDLVKEKGIGENWDKLKAILQKSNYAKADEIIALMNEIKDPDEREMRIREHYPTEYNLIRDEIYPELRAVDFIFHLSRRGMVEDVVYSDVIDTEYADALKLMDRRKYKEAMPKLIEYQDWNTAICYMSLGYNDTALKLFKRQKQSSDRDYMMSILLARLGKTQEAVDLYLQVCREDESKIERGELDPEISQLINEFHLRDQLYAM